MTRAKTAALICIFFLDVHVKAETVGACWGKTIPCPVVGESPKKVISAEDLKLSLGPGALLEQIDDKTVQVVKGEFYVETSRPVVFKTPYAKLWCADACKALFKRVQDEFEIKSLEGSWLLERKGDKQTYSVREGSRVAVSEVGEDGKAQMEFPQSLPWAPTVKSLASLYPGKFEELRPTLVKFRGAWKEAVENVSELQSKAAQRTLASYEDAQAKERARKAAVEREDERLRALFREKNP